MEKGVAGDDFLTSYPPNGGVAKSGARERFDVAQPAVLSRDFDSPTLAC